MCNEKIGVGRNEDREIRKAQVMTSLYVLLRSECGINSKHDKELWKYYEWRSDIDI